MILSCLSPRWLAGRDDPNIEIVWVNLAESMVNDEEHSTFIQSKSYPAVFFLAMLFIFDRQHVEVKKDLRSVLETDFVVSQVPFCFCWIPFKVVLHGSPPTAKSSGMAKNRRLLELARPKIRDGSIG